MSGLTDVRKKAICINDYVEDIMNDYADLWDDYLDVLKERDELAERVKELEEKE